MLSETYGCQDLIIAVKKGVDFHVNDFFRDNDLRSYDLIEDIGELERYEEAFKVDLINYVDSHDIYVIYFVSIPLEDVWDIDEKYLANISDDNDCENAWDKYLDDWFEALSKVINLIKQNNDNDIDVLFFRQDVESA